MATLLPKVFETTGSTLTGSDGGTNRTLTLPNSNVSSTGIRVFVNGTFLHQGTGNDYTLSSNVVTFLNAIFNFQTIAVHYFIEESASVSPSLGFSTVFSFVKHIQALATIPNRQDQALEELGTGDNSLKDFWLNKLGIIENEFTISHGTVSTSVTDLTLTTDYTLDLDNSKLILTSGGVTAVGTDKIFADYKYNIHQLLNSEMVEALTSAQEKIKRDTEQTFANFTDSDPSYRKVVDEIREGHFDIQDKVFDAYWQPIVRIQTTTNGAYTTGGTTITLTDASGLPNAGTIYIGENKVVYTARTLNDLTILSSTPSIADDATVRGEVIEVSKEVEGNDPVYDVIVPEKEYEIDYLHGRIAPLRKAFFGELTNSDVIFPANYKVRLTYFSAWYDKGSNPSVPQDIEEATNMIAAKKFVQRIIKKTHIEGQNNFNPNALNSGDDEIERILTHYKTLNVGHSMYNKQDVS